MSTEVPEQSQFEKTKQQIRKLLSEIAQLSESDVTDEEFYPHYLSRVLAALAAPAGALWMLNDEGALRLVYQINWQQIGLERLPESAQQQHAMLLQQMIANNRGATFPARSGVGDSAEERVGNPTDFLIVAGPLSIDGQSLGIVEVFHNPAAPPTVQQGYLRFLAQVCELGSGYLKNRRLRSLVDRQHLWSRLESFSRQVHTTLKTRSVAFTVANDGRRLIGCDRVSVAIRHGKRMRIEAISGQDVVDRRANLTQMMTRLVDAVVYAGEPLSYTGSTDDLPPKIEEALRDYVDEGSSKAIFIVPLCEPTENPEQTSPPFGALPFGALVVEQIEDNRPEAQLKELTEIVVRHSETALHNALRYHRVFLLPLWQWIGGEVSRLRGSRLAKFAAILAVLIGIAGTLALVPKEFRLEGSGRLMPENRRDLFAGEDAIVRKIFSEHGDRVDEGQVLVEMENIDLNVRLQGSQAELIKSDDSIKIKQSQIYDRSLSSAEKHQVRGELLALETTHGRLEREIDLLQRRADRLTLRSPISGIVTTWDVANRLENRPVQRGNLLLSVAKDSGSWILEVKVPEDRIGHILRANQRLSPGESLPVVYVLATQPENRFRGTVKRIAARTEVDEDEGNVVLITVALDPDSLPPLRPGAEVKAGVVCGKRALGYVLFHEIIEAWYSRVLFYFGW